jgi:alkylhydroperoxidase family enzyme
MARIDLVGREDASPGVAALYDEFESMGVPLLNVAKVFANHEDFLGGFVRMAKALYATPTLDPRLRELAYLRASQLNSCHY